jgi:hypothetical protein
VQHFVLFYLTWRFSDVDFADAMANVLATLHQSAFASLHSAA